MSHNLPKFVLMSELAHNVLNACKSKLFKSNLKKKKRSEHKKAHTFYLQALNSQLFFIILHFCFARLRLGINIYSYVIKSRELEVYVAK